ncbi:hypothetical protein C8R45DRAFT_1156396 [Mycena sanguinolenta]|nr:hypothetical protein C8R45DRAFT_1156396 [Mycena sanguinolenta]
MAKDKKLSKATLSGTEELHHMREKIRKQDAQIDAFHELSSPRVLIKSTGYNLQAEMGLDGNKGSKTRYNRLMRIVKDNVHQHLSVQKTLSKQDPKTLEQTIALIATIAPFFARFEGFWPVHDVIGTYLINMQNRCRCDLRKEKEADERDARGDVNEDDSSGDSSDDLEEDDSEEAEPARAPKRKQKTKRPAAKKRIDSDSDLAEADDEENEDTFHDDQGDKKDDLQTKRRAPLAERSSQQIESKRKAPRPPSTEPPPKKLKTKHQHVPAFVPHSIKIPLLAWSNLPSECPSANCIDDMPEEPNQRLLSLFSQHETLIRAGQTSAPGLEFASLQICAAIRQEDNLESYFELGRRNGWPQTIDYTALVSRVLSLQEHLSAMIKHKELLMKSTIWHSFLDSINFEIFTFSRSSRKSDYTYAMYARRCGYYGVKGAFLINSTIQRALADDENALGYALYNTLHRFICDDCERHDEYDADSHLIDLNAFIFFVLTPFAAALLIAVDLNVDLDEAEDIRDASNEYGDVMQPDNGDDWLLEDLHEQNLREIGSPGLFLRPPHYRNFYEEQPEPSLAIVKQEESSEKKSSKLSFLDFVSVRRLSVSDASFNLLLDRCRWSKAESRINRSNNEHEIKTKNDNKSTKGTILSDNDLGKAKITVQKSGQFKGKAISVNDFPEINPKKAKDSKRKDSKTKDSKKKEVVLDNLDEPDAEPPKKKSKKEPVPPKAKAVKENPVKSDYRTRARARKADK